MGQEGGRVDARSHQHHHLLGGPRVPAKGLPQQLQSSGRPSNQGGGVQAGVRQAKLVAQ